MKGSQNLISQDSYKILKQNTNVSFKTNNKLLTVVKQDVTACVQSAFLWRRRLH